MAREGSGYQGVRSAGGRQGVADRSIDTDRGDVLFIPAQRVLALTRDGWLRTFSDYKPGDPYVVRDFSEKLRLSMESGLGNGDSIFPRERHLKSEIRGLVESAVLPGFNLRIEKGRQRRLVLGSKTSDSALPFMVWSMRPGVRAYSGTVQFNASKSDEGEPSHQMGDHRRVGGRITPEGDFGHVADRTRSDLARIPGMLIHTLSSCAGSDLGASGVSGASRVADSCPGSFRRRSTTRHDKSCRISSPGRKPKCFTSIPSPERRATSPILIQVRNRQRRRLGPPGLTEFSGRVTDQVARVVAEDR